MGNFGEENLDDGKMGWHVHRYMEIITGADTYDSIAIFSDGKEYPRCELYSWIPERGMAQTPW